MWYAVVIRILRRRIVLTIIFLLSLTYCLVNLWGNSGNSYKDIEEIEYKREQPLIWREDTISNGTNGERPDECRNSVQGKILLVDDEGYVCHRNNLLSNGCCDSNENIQYTCDTCNTEEGCCAVYEKCVSCCLNPNKRSILEKAMEMASGRQTALFATVSDQFELCLAKCRTDSHSVQHENKYKNPETKFCYAYIEAHESQRDN
ncbi:SREBP regulating gene protein [Sitodiplosis mosellana]|uniref:SREBP regulating gene protein n=1 Tax=Sitodiplosis mosellana TaxID=263140 RepID=UPI002444B004|nr:SREBP regulating gene protein [Sitodiplosis mosellana]